MMRAIGVVIVAGTLCVLLTVIPCVSGSSWPALPRASLKNTGETLRAVGVEDGLDVISSVYVGFARQLTDHYVVSDPVRNLEQQMEEMRQVLEGNSSNLIWIRSRIIVIRAGWPFRWVQGWMIEYTNEVRARKQESKYLLPIGTPYSATRFDPELRYLPLRIRWIALCMNIVIFSFASAVCWWAIGAIVAGIRVRRGNCPLCKYNLRSEIGRGCPECGWNRPENEGQELSE